MGLFGHRNRLSGSGSAGDRHGLAASEKKKNPKKIAADCLMHQAKDKAFSCAAITSTPSEDGVLGDLWGGVAVQHASTGSGEVMVFDDI